VQNVAGNWEFCLVRFAAVLRQTWRWRSNGSREILCAYREVLYAEHKSVVFRLRGCTTQEELQHHRPFYISADSSRHRKSVGLLALCGKHTCRRHPVSCNGYNGTTLFSWCTRTTPLCFTHRNTHFASSRCLSIQCFQLHQTKLRLPFTFCVLPTLLLTRFLCAVNFPFGWRIM
jgi:hypothetical protein